MDFNKPAGVWKNLKIIENGLNNRSLFFYAKKRAFLKPFSDLWAISKQVSSQKRSTDI
jgi:hypothetical protein